MAYAEDLKFSGAKAPCGFDPRPRHQQSQTGPFWESGLPTATVESSSVPNGTASWPSGSWPRRARVSQQWPQSMYVEGRLTTSAYEAKDGSGKRYRTEIVARQIRFLAKRGDASEVTRASEEFVPF